MKNKIWALVENVGGISILASRRVYAHLAICHLLVKIGCCKLDYTILAGCSADCQKGQGHQKKLRHPDLSDFPEDKHSRCTQGATQLAENVRENRMKAVWASESVYRASTGSLLPVKPAANFSIII